MNSVVRVFPLGHFLLLGWRPSVLGWRPSLVGGRPSLLDSLSLSHGDSQYQPFRQGRANISRQHFPSCQDFPFGGSKTYTATHGPRRASVASTLRVSLTPDAGGTDESFKPFRDPVG